MCRELLTVAYEYRGHSEDRCTCARNFRRSRSGDSCASKVRAFERCMKVAGKKVDIEIYRGAGHAFENPAHRGHRRRLPPTRGLARSNSSSRQQMRAAKVPAFRNGNMTDLTKSSMAKCRIRVRVIFTHAKAFECR